MFPIWQFHYFFWLTGSLKIFTVSEEFKAQHDSNGKVIGDSEYFIVTWIWWGTVNNILYNVLHITSSASTASSISITTTVRPKSSLRIRSPDSGPLDYSLWVCYPVCWPELYFWLESWFVSTLLLFDLPVREWRERIGHPHHRHHPPPHDFLQARKLIVIRAWSLSASVGGGGEWRDLEVARWKA